MSTQIRECERLVNRESVVARIGPCDSVTGSTVQRAVAALTRRIAGGIASQPAVKDVKLSSLKPEASTMLNFLFAASLSQGTPTSHTPSWITQIVSPDSHRHDAHHPLVIEDGYSPLRKLGSCRSTSTLPPRRLFRVWVVCFINELKE